MSWETITTQAIDIKKEKGTSHEGVYVGSKAIKTKLGDQTIWEFRDAEGATFGIYGFTNLNRAMERATEGWNLRITYLGMENVQTKFGLKDVHQVSVERWRDDGESDAADPGSVKKSFDPDEVPF